MTKNLWVWGKAWNSCEKVTAWGGGDIQIPGAASSQLESPRPVRATVSRKHPGKCLLRTPETILCLVYPYTLAFPPLTCMHIHTPPPHTQTLVFAHTRIRLASH